MSCISVAWGAGVVVGPLISGEKCLHVSSICLGLFITFKYMYMYVIFLLYPGYVAEPATQFPSVFSQEGIFGRLPYLLPALIAAAMCLPPILIAAWQLPETKGW